MPIIFEKDSNEKPVLVEDDLRSVEVTIVKPYISRSVEVKTIQGTL